MCETTPLDLVHKCSPGKLSFLQCYHLRLCTVMLYANRLVVDIEWGPISDNEGLHRPLPTCAKVLYKPRFLLLKKENKPFKRICPPTLNHSFSFAEDTSYLMESHLLSDMPVMPL